MNRPFDARGIPPVTSDRFGIPSNTFGFVPEEFYGALGRVAALGALVESRFAAVVAELTNAAERDVATQMGRLNAEFDKITKAREAAGSPLPDRLVACCNAASGAMRQRNAIIHSLWPEPRLEQAAGWRMVRSRQGGATSRVVEWTEVTIDDLRDLIGALVVAEQQLRDVVAETEAAPQSGWSARADPASG